MSRCIVLYILFAAAVALRGAEFSIPSSRLPATGTWASAGVPNVDFGEAVPNYVTGRTTIHTTISTTGDSTDRTSEINAAIASCPSNQVVMLGPGTFRCDGTIGIGFSKTNITLRGTQNPDGSPATIIDTRANYGIQLGTEFGYETPTAGVSATMATLTKGATSITVASTSDFSAGMLIVIIPEVESETPILKVYGTQPYRAPRAQTARIASVPDSTTLTLEAPGLHGDFSNCASAKIWAAPFSTRGCGIEDIWVNGENRTPQGPYSNINFASAYGCWVYNCKSTGANNYQATVFLSFKSEIRRLWTEGLDSGSSTVNVLLSNTSSFLVIDSVLADGPYGFFQQDLSSGNVLAYSFIINTTSSAVNPGYSNTSSNHGPWNQFTYLEGNIGSYYQNDGYFGGSGYTTIFRNWLMGSALNFVDSGFSVSLNRFSRYENIIGNILGRTGVGGGGISMGNPNMGNSNSYGVSSMGGAASVLSSRTSDTVGTITAPSGHGITTGSTIDVYWRTEYASNQWSAAIRYGVTVGTVSGTSIPISGGVGDALPAPSAEIFVPTSNDALWSYSLDWNSTTQTVQEWTGTLSTRTSDSAGVVTLDSGQAASFNAALANASNDGRGLTTTALQIGFITVTGVSGNDVTFESASATLPAQGTSVRLVPCPYGYQEFDLDVIRTTLPKANYYGLASGSGIPTAQSIGSDTLPNSLFLSGAPEFFNVAGLSWPPIDPNSPVTNTYELIPAGQAYVAGWWVADVNTVATPQFSPSPGTHAAGTTITITCATSGSTIHYTVDGSTPTTGSAVYSSPLSLSVGTTVVKALAVKATMTDSAVQSGTYILVNAPVAASGLDATTASTTQINVTWNDNSDNETGFRLERRIGAGSWGTVTTTAANATSYSNTGLTPATTYEYRVYAVNVAGDSTASNTDTATTNSEGGGAANATINQFNVGTLVIP